MQPINVSRSINWQFARSIYKRPSGKFCAAAIEVVLDNNGCVKLNRELTDLDKEVDYAKFSKYFTDIF